MKSNERSTTDCVRLTASHPTTTMSAASTTRPLAGSPNRDTRFDRRLAEILDCATEIFASKGYEGASMRDLSRLSGISLAGLYYYFESKEKLLYFIQRHTLATIIERLRERLAASDNPEERIRIFVHNHVDYAVAKMKAMKVLSHEDDILKDGYGTELSAIKREYYRICMILVDDLAKAEGLEFGVRGHVGTRTAVMGLFGTMNWLYTWYNPRVDPDAQPLAREISNIFLQGVRGGRTAGGKSQAGATSSLRTQQVTGRPKTNISSRISSRKQRSLPPRRQTRQ